MVLVNHLILFDLLRLEVRDVQGAHGFQGREDGVVERSSAIRSRQLVAHLAQRAQDAGAVETLSLTVFAEAHGAYFPSFTTIATLLPSGATAIRVTSPSLWAATS